MASPLETEGSFLTQAQADHINERHVFRTEHVKTSNFWLQFNLVNMLKNLSELTWEQDNEDVVLLEQGWKESHGHFYLYVFKVHEQIGFDPEDFPANHIVIYYSEKVPGCFKTERNSHSHTQRVYSNTQKKRDKETPKREEERR